MYDEMVKRLRDAAKMSEALAVLLPHSEGNATADLYRRAADAIEELSKPRWIPVEERLPDKEENVLVCLNGCISVVSFSPKHLQFNNYDILPYDSNNRFDDVKYWMPLPELPKEE